MSPVEFVLIDGIAIGLLISDAGRQRFCGSTRNLQDFENLPFDDLEDAQTFFADRLSHGSRIQSAEARQP